MPLTTNGQPAHTHYVRVSFKNGDHAMHTPPALDPHLLRDLEPLDEHNSRLLEAVHPPAWINPTPAVRYNMIVVGGGTAGLVTAAGAAGLGAKVALIERRLLGGDCLNFGCVPSKTLIRSARAVADVRGAGELGVSVTAGARVFSVRSKNAGLPTPRVSKPAQASPPAIVVPKAEPTKPAPADAPKTPDAAPAAPASNPK